MDASTDTEFLERFRQTALESHRPNAYIESVKKAKVDPSSNHVLGIIEYQAKRHNIRLDQQTLDNLALDYDEARLLSKLPEIDPDLDHLALTDFFLQQRGIYQKTSGFTDRIRQLRSMITRKMAFNLAGASALTLAAASAPQIGHGASYLASIAQNTLTQPNNSNRTSILPTSSQNPNRITIVSGMGSVREKEGQEKKIPPQIKLTEAPLVKFGGSFGDVDSNSPLHWDKNTVYLFNSSKTGVTRYSGNSINNFGKPESVTFDKQISGSRWIESTYPYNGKLYGWYHQEQFDYNLPKRDQVLTIPRIGALVSENNGKTWKDLGFIMDTPANSINPETKNLFFAGGNGDFSVIPDTKGEYFYFLTTNYDKDLSQQGISIARIKSSDLNNPQNKVWKWFEGKWQQPASEGKVTPIFPAKGDVHKNEADFFWGPSIEWNEYLQTYVMVMSHSANAAFTQEGIYISFNADLSKPKEWSVPQKIKSGASGTSWYPQIVGIDQLENSTDKAGGKYVRLFERGESSYILEFKKPGEIESKHSFGNIDTPNPTFFRPGTSERVTLPMGEKQVQILRPAGNNRFVIQTSIGILEIPMNQLDVQGNFSWEKEVKPMHWLGFDSSDPNLIDKLPQIGAGVARIVLNQADSELANDRTQVAEAIKKAKEKNLEILLLYNPTKSLSQPELSKKLDRILSTVQGYNKVMFEFGNEPDIWPFWENQDLASYAQSLKQASDLVKQKRPDIQQVIAAASKPENIGTLVKEIKQAGVDTNQFIFSLHAYHQIKGAPIERIRLLRQYAGNNARFMFDEIGVNTSEEDKIKILPQMIKEARESGAERVIVFKLDNYPFTGTVDKGLWGILKPEGKWEKSASGIINFNWEQTH